MNTKNFFVGMGLGMVAGGTLGMLVAPKHNAKNGVSRALRTMGDVIDDVSAALK